MVGSAPGCAGKTSGRLAAPWRVFRQVVLDPFEPGTDVVAQGLKPGPRLVLAALERGRLGKGGGCCRVPNCHRNSSVWRKASPAAIATAIGTLSERSPGCN